MKQKDGMPIMVFLGLLGINSRALALFFVWLCVLLGAASALAAAALFSGAVALDPPLDIFAAILAAVCAVTLFACALWYAYALRWVDRHSSWD